MACGFWKEVGGKGEGEGREGCGGMIRYDTCIIPVHMITRVTSSWGRFRLCHGGTGVGIPVIHI